MNCWRHIWVRYNDGPARVTLSVLRVVQVFVRCAFCGEGAWL